MKKIRNIKGTKDLLPKDTPIWRALEKKIHNFLFVEAIERNLRVNQCE